MKTGDHRFDVIGNRELCAWIDTPGICRIQTRSPQHARRLAQRTDTNLVAREYASGYLRVFIIRRPLAIVEQLISRYQSKQTATNRAFSTLAGDSSARKTINQLQPCQA
jgi:hypothetical protein